MHICCFNRWWDFPDGPVVKNLPSNPGDEGLISGWGTKIPQAQEQLSPRNANRGAHMLQSSCAATREKPACSVKSQYAPTKI